MCDVTTAVRETYREVGTVSETRSRSKEQTFVSGVQVGWWAIQQRGYYSFTSIGVT
jgi:hypothetical protein